MAYSFAQLEGLWIKNGGSKAMAPIMAAIALAESSGNPNAMNKTDNSGKQTSWGLWQISNGTHAQPVNNILDPDINAQQAVKKLSSQGLKAWGVYTSGAYKKYYKGGVPADTSMPSGSTTVVGGANATQAGLSGDLGAAIGQGFAQAFLAVLQPITSFIIWGAEISIGGALMLAGLFVFISHTDKVQGEVEGTRQLALKAVPETQAAE
jgi:hypothetical protein